ncbi:hypothetical protein WN943_027522 [Citrus x changshan-huyou]
MAANMHFFEQPWKPRLSTVVIAGQLLAVDPTYDWGHMMLGSYVFDLTMLHYVGPAVVIQDDPHPNQNNGLQANADDPHPNQNNGQQQNAGPMQNGD